MKLVVLGGNGFVGRAICREGIKRGWQVASLSRSGAPPSTSSDAELAKVEWHEGSALDLNSYQSLLPTADFLVHSIGTLIEDTSTADGSYQAKNRDTAQLALRAIHQFSPNIKGVAYISANTFGPVGDTLLSGYTTMKREGEQLVLNDRGQFKKIIARPGFIYGPGRWLTYPIAIPTFLATIFTAGLLPRPVHVDQVARAIISELVLPGPGNAAVNGDGVEILEVKDIIAKGY